MVAPFRLVNDLSNGELLVLTKPEKRPLITRVPRNPDVYLAFKGDERREAVKV